MEMPRFENLAPKLNKVTIGSVSVWFSYETPIAFKVNNSLIVHDNIWSKTTGRHLNLIDGGEENNIQRRFNSVQFKTLWDSKVGELFVGSLFSN